MKVYSAYTCPPSTYTTTSSGYSIIGKPATATIDVYSISEKPATATTADIKTTLDDEALEKIAQRLATTIDASQIGYSKREDAVKEENQLSKVTYKRSGKLKADCVRTFPAIEKVIFNPPATVVMWSDGTKTVVKIKETGKKKEKDKFSEEYGLAMAIAKKYFGTRSGFLKAIKNAQRPDIPKAIVKKDAK